MSKIDIISVYTDHTGGRDLLQFRWAIRSPSVWRSGADPGGIGELMEHSSILMLQSTK